MKILFFGKYDINDLVGGIERYVHLLRTHLPQNIQTENLVANVTSETVRIGSTTKVGALCKLSSVSFCPTMPFIFSKILKERQPDIIHLQFPDPMANLAYFLCNPKHLKIVISWHSDIVRQKKLYFLYRPLLNWILKRSDAVIVHSEALKKSKQLSVVSQNKIHVIPIGIEAPVISNPTIRDKMSGHFILFSVGRHVAYKGYDYLIRALAKLPEDCHLYLGGTGPETDKLKNLAISLKVEHRIHFIGYIPEKDLGSYIAACDVFCFSSISQNEAFGITQIEAMMLRKPVVSFELHNGTTYINQNEITGLVVENKNIDKYAQAILRLKNDSGLRLRLGIQAQKRASDLFSVEKMVAKTAALYRSLINQRYLYH